MNNRNRRITRIAGPITCAALLATLTGCMSDGSNNHREYGTRSGVPIQATLVIQDDYDYYPAYEVYYGRNRQEYVYRDGRAWVRRPAPRGVTVESLRLSPSVRVDFHDSPERHHRTVVRTYPKHWAPPPKVRDDVKIEIPTEVEHDRQDLENDIKDRENDRIPHDRRD